VNTSTITNWELGHREPRIHTLGGIIDFLGYVPFEIGETLPEKLSAYRAIKGLTQEAVSAEMEIDKMTWRQWKAGARDLGMHAVEPSHPLLPPPPTSIQRPVLDRLSQVRLKDLFAAGQIDSIRPSAEKGPGPAAATADNLKDGVHGLAAVVARGEVPGKSFCRLFDGPGQPFQFTKHGPRRNSQLFG
jgi:transcriptional regulator with XRE-family HTH domain